MNNSLIILLHGVGSSGDDLRPLAEAWKHQLPDSEFASPNVPTHSDFGQGYQWFSVVGVTKQNRPRRIQAARASFDDTLACLMAGTGVGGAGGKVVLAGFCPRRDHCVECGRFRPLAGGEGGRFFRQACDAGITAAWGQYDVISASESPLAARLLTAVGMKATAKIFPGLGHTLSSGGTILAGRFIAQAVGRGM